MSRSGPDTRRHAKPRKPPAARRFVPGWVTPSVVVCGQRRQAPKARQGAQHGQRVDRRQLPERLRAELRTRGPGDLRHGRRGAARHPAQRRPGARGRGVHPRRERVRPAVHRARAAGRDARHGRAPAVGQAGRPARGRLRLGQRGRARSDRRDRGGPVRLRAGPRGGAGTQRARRRRAEAPGRGRLDRPRGPGRDVHVAVHVQPAGRRVRPALRPERRAPARHRRAQHAQRQGQPARADPRLVVRPGRLRRRRPGQPGRRGPAAAHRLRSGHRRGGRRAAGFRPF